MRHLVHPVLYCLDELQDREIKCELLYHDSKNDSEESSGGAHSVKVLDSNEMHVELNVKRSGEYKLILTSNPYGFLTDAPLLFRVGSPSEIEGMHAL